MNPTMNFEHLVRQLYLAYGKIGPTPSDLFRAGDPIGQTLSEPIAPGRYGLFNPTDNVD